MKEPGAGPSGRGRGVVATAALAVLFLAAFAAAKFGIGRGTAVPGVSRSYDLAVRAPGQRGLAPLAG